MKPSFTAMLILLSIVTSVTSDRALAQEPITRGDELTVHRVELFSYGDSGYAIVSLSPRGKRIKANQYVVLNLNVESPEDYRSVHRSVELSPAEQLSLEVKDAVDADKVLSQFFFGKDIGGEGFSQDMLLTRLRGLSVKFKESAKGKDSEGVLLGFTDDDVALLVSAGDSVTIKQIDKKKLILVGSVEQVWGDLQQAAEIQQRRNLTSGRSIRVQPSNRAADVEDVVVTYRKDLKAEQHWKLEYRLLLDANVIQARAKLSNFTAYDWKGVEVVLHNGHQRFELYNVTLTSQQAGTFPIVDRSGDLQEWPVTAQLVYDATQVAPGFAVDLVNDREGGSVLASGRVAIHHGGQFVGASGLASVLPHLLPKLIPGDLPPCPREKENQVTLEIGAHPHLAVTRTEFAVQPVGVKETRRDTLSYYEGRKTAYFVMNNSEAAQGVTIRLRARDTVEVDGATENWKYVQKNGCDFTSQCEFSIRVTVEAGESGQVTLASRSPTRRLSLRSGNLAQLKAVQHVSERRSSFISEVISRRKVIDAQAEQLATLESERAELESVRDAFIDSVTSAHNADSIRLFSRKIRELQKEIERKQAAIRSMEYQLDEMLLEPHFEDAA